MAHWPDSAQKISNGYYKVATDADEILVGDTEDDIDYSKRQQLSQNHAHYYKKDRNWFVRNKAAGKHQEIYTRYGGSQRGDERPSDWYGEALYGETGELVDEGVSSWLDGLLR
ncbi:hypothetical protein [Microcoleus sp. bin38.metabat.b11b12b14.051]|uniref:hypothetical protein n=1 Tax=Microcoleus sp. bin38.metabat.b11b12b14.051 TaxID=2742709 RepID=UPI0025D1B270|nr:hypothetical protein [Microcoleus sp. bin38.metabat.b11b12b14.051]